jgi:cytochrome c556
MKRSTLLLALSCTLAGAAYAASPADLISARQQNYKAIGKANKAIQEEIKKPEMSIDTIRTNAAALERLAKQIPGWFPRGTGPDAGVKTGALPAIWERPDEFKKDAARLAGFARGLNQSVAKGDLDKVRAYGPALGNACKSCHETFRQRTS